MKTDQLEISIKLYWSETEAYSGCLLCVCEYIQQTRISRLRHNHVNAMHDGAECLERGWRAQ